VLQLSCSDGQNYEPNACTLSTTGYMRSHRTANIMSDTVWNGHNMIATLYFAWSEQPAAQTTFFMSPWCWRGFRLPMPCSRGHAYMHLQCPEVCACVCMCVHVCGGEGGMLIVLTGCTRCKVTFYTFHQDLPKAMCIPCCMVLFRLPSWTLV
jgi:hypothetical protein